jgi:hypothetical protein
MGVVNRRSVLTTAGAALIGGGVAGGAEARDDYPKVDVSQFEKATPNQERLLTVGNLLIASYNQTTSGANGYREYALTVNFGRALTGVVTMMSSFDVNYTSGGGYKVQRTAAGVRIASVNLATGVVVVLYKCAMFDDDGGHGYSGNIIFNVIATTA